MQQTIPTPDELQRMLLGQMNLSESEQEVFLSPKYELGDPFLFADMNVAVERIKGALEGGEHIGIYADYDCDGIPGAVVLLDFFKKIGAGERVHVYIPDRHDEGYGVNIRGIDELQKSGVTLMVTVDVGITALAEIAEAQSRGIDVIVTDHHAPLAEFPLATAIVHPAKGNANIDLCGAAVAFMLVRGFLSRYGKEYAVPEGWERTLLDLVGFATLSDMVPLIGENRVLAHFGLIIMRMTKRIGLRVLFAANMLDQRTITETDLTFTVAPRLNAASRMKSPMLAFELLATNDMSRAKEIVAELTLINDERKKLVARITKDAHKRLEARELPDIVVIGDLTWRPAVLGLVANKLQEHYKRSFFVWGESGDGVIKGSCRMLPEHHAAYLFQALPEGLMLHAGGHQAAGGFAIAKEQIHFLEQSLNDAIARVAHDPKDVQAVENFSVPLAIATTRHHDALRTFAPFGTGNPQPVFQFENVEILSAKKFGKTKEHFECTIKDVTGVATAFTFFAPDMLIATCVPGATVSFTATLELGWKGGVRLRIQDII